MTTATYKMTTAAYKSAVSSIKTRSANVTKDIHRACVAAMLFSADDKNATPALQLVQALSAGMPRNKVINWFHHFTNVRITAAKQKDGSFAWTVKNLSPDHEEFTDMTEAQRAEAIKKAYWDLQPETDIKEVDIQALLSNVLKRVNAAKAAGKLKVNPANDQRIAALAAMCKTSEEISF